MSFRGSHYRYRYTTEKTFGHSKWRPPFPVADNVHPRHFKCPLPMNDAEFAVLSKVFFGAPLSLSKLWLYGDGTRGQAEIAERYDSFNGPGFPFGGGEIAGYDRLTWFWETVMGPMDHSRSLTWTSFRIFGHRQRRRIESWVESRRTGRVDHLRPAFVRLAHQVGMGENIASRNRPPADGVLTRGREDGARAASFTRGAA